MTGAAEVDAPPRRQRRRFIAFTAVVVIVAVWFIGYTWRRVAALQERARCLGELHAHGEPLSVQEMVNERPPTPNGAANLMRALLLSGGDSVRFVGVNADATENIRAVCGEVPPTGVDVLPGRLIEEVWDRKPGSHPDLAPALTVLPKIRKLLARATADRPGRLTVRFNSQHLHWTPMLYAQDVRRLAALLHVDVIHLLAKTDQRAACRSLAILARLGRTLDEEPLLGTYMMQGWIDVRVLKTLAACLEAGPISDEDEAVLDAAFADWRGASPRAGLRAQLWGAFQLFEPESADLLPGFLTSGGGRDGPMRKLLSSLRARYLASSLGLPDRLQAQNRFMRAYLDSLPWIDAAERSQATADVERQWRADPSPKAVALDLRSSIEQTMICARRIRAASLVARLSWILERRRRNGHGLPKSVDSIAGEIRGGAELLKESPIEYARLSDGFSLGCPIEGNDRMPIGVEVKFRSTAKP